jgi:hypothetical protein
VKPFTVYIASMFSDKDRVKQRASELALRGIACSSRWAEETVPHNVTIQECKDEYLTETAVIDIDDILSADKVVLTVPENDLLVDATVAASSRGGRHFESGLFYGIILAAFLAGKDSGRELIILGKKENVFHFLDGKGVAKKYPAIRVIANWEELKTYLLEEKDVYESRSGCN